MEWQWIKENKDVLLVIASFTPPLWAVFGLYLGNRLTLNSQRTIKNFEVEQSELTKQKLSNGILGSALAEAIHNTHVLLYLHNSVGYCAANMENGSVRASLAAWLTKERLRDSMWTRMSLSDTVAERQPDALVKLATCYYGAENAFAMASLLAGENGSDCGEVFGQLMQLTARRCSEAASWITALVFDHKELWDVVGTETIILLAELRRQNLKADGVLITDRDMRRALHEVIARYGEFVAQWAPLLAENCSQALDALGLSEERLTSIEFAEFQKRGLVRQDFLSGDQDLPK